MLTLIAVALSFAVLGTLIYNKVKFGYSILIASGLLLFLSTPSYEALIWVKEISLEYETIRLILIIVQIGLLGFLYKDSEQVVRMIKELKGLVPDRRMVIASIPAIFGLMPMPGGALVSAPLIDNEGDDLELSDVHKTFMNWWFRHVWFTIYPLSLSLILASALSGVGLYKIALYNTPIFFAHLIIGVIWGVNKIDRSPSQRLLVNPFRLIWSLLPIIIALLLNMILNIPLYISLVVGILTLLVQNKKRYGLDKVPTLLRKGFSLDLFLAAYGIMLFQGIIRRTNSIEPAVVHLQNYIPLFIVVILVSISAGIFFGHLPGAIGVVFPVFTVLLPVINVQTVSLMFLFIFLGYFISPIHLCIILTIEYFGINLKSFYKRMILPTTILIIVILTWITVTGTPFFFF
ncbi:MAG: DUF401 family protein [Thermoplasmatota archaeon]